MKICFPDYPGPDNDYKAAVEFIKERFEGLDQRRAHTRVIKLHETCATDTGNVKVVFADVDNFLMNKNLAGVFG